ncbi:MAG: hypothetical protein ACOVO9_11245 [Bacteroidia bacterium]
MVASLFLFLIFFSCGKPKKEFILKVKLNKLQGDQIFDKDLVLDMVFDANEFGLDSVQRIAQQIFLEGLDQYKNKKNTIKAITLFKESLLYFPSAKTYYELGNAMLGFRQNQALLEQAQTCFEIAQDLSFKPEYAVHLKLAKTAYLMEKLRKDDDNYRWWRVRHEIENAFNTGFFDTTAIQSDPDFAEFVKSPSYRVLVIENLAKNASGGSFSKFDIFKNSFTNHNPDLKIAENEVSMENYKQSISYEFADYIPEMENVSFGREVSNDFYYVAKVAETPEYVALVYATSSFDGEGYQPVETILAVYNNQGKQISRKVIACQCNAERIKTCSFNSGKLTIEEKKRNWEKPIKDFGPDDNTVVSVDLIAKAVFSFKNTGMIEAEDVPANFNDSIRIAKN